MNVVSMLVKKRSRSLRIHPYSAGTKPTKRDAVGDHLPQTRQASSAVGGRVELRKKFGQHLLHNPGILHKIVVAASIKSTDHALEIGPGTGNLTIRLLPLCKEVTALDIDERMVSEVQQRARRLGFQNLKAKVGDAVRGDLGVFDVCTANLPYQISSKFLFKLIGHRPLFRTAVLMFQKEFAERLIARPGEKQYCRLTLNAQLFCTIERVATVKASNFTPPPKVDSVIVRLCPRKPQPQIDFLEWDGLVRICFSRRSRTLRGNFLIKSVLANLEHNYKTWCSSCSQVPRTASMKDTVSEVLDEVKLSQRRAATISVDEFLELLVAFNKRGIHFRNVTASQGRLQGAAPQTSIPNTIDDATMVSGLLDYMNNCPPDFEYPEIDTSDTEDATL